MRTLFEACSLALILLMVAYGLFVSLEPTMARGQSAQGTFTIELTVTDQIAFTVAPQNVTLSPALSGLTGGTANGGTQVVVRTNNATGYNMTLVASSSLGMLGLTSTGTIPAYVPSSAGVPDYNFTTPANTGRFGYSVSATTTTDVAPLFRDNGTDTCNTGANNTTGACWLNASTSAVTIINRSTPTDSNGATTTIFFRAVITSNPSPAIPNDTYRATTTLTVTEN